MRVVEGSPTDMHPDEENNDMAVSTERIKEEVKRDRTLAG